MKAYAQPIATTLLALSIASLPFTWPRFANAQLSWGDTIKVEQKGSWYMECN